MRDIYQQLDQAIGQMKGKTLCAEGNGNCCSRDVALLPTDQKLLEEGIASGAVSEETLRTAHQKAQRSGNKCPFLGDDKTCTIYEYRPLVCRNYGFAGIPKNEADAEKLDEMYRADQNAVVPARTLNLAACGDCKKDMNRRNICIPIQVLYTAQGAYAQSMSETMILKARGKTSLPLLYQFAAKLKV